MTFQSQPGLESWLLIFYLFGCPPIYIRYNIGNSALPGVSFYNWTHSTWNVQTKLRTFPLFYRVLQTKFEENRSIGFFAIAGHPKRHFLGKLLYIYKVLAWEPSFACRSKQFLKLNIFVVWTSCHVKIWSKSVKRWMSYDQTYQ